MIKVDETIFSDSKYLVYDLIETKQNKLPESETQKHKLLTCVTSKYSFLDILFHENLKMLSFIANNFRANCPFSEDF